MQQTIYIGAECQRKAYDFIDFYSQAPHNLLSLQQLLNNRTQFFAFSLIIIYQQIKAAVTLFPTNCAFIPLSFYRNQANSWFFTKKDVSMDAQSEIKSHARHEFRHTVA
jgi:hypothetical protein